MNATVEAIRRTLARHGVDIGASPCRIEPLAGGIGQRSVRVRCAGRDLVARLGGADIPGALPLADEAAIGRAAADAGLAPRVVAADPDTGLLITEFLPASRAFEAHDLRTPALIERCAALLRRLHALACRPRVFDPEGFAAHYIARLGGLPALDAPARAHAHEFLALAAEFARAHRADALCHNDLVASNLFESGGRLWLIDFEYAVTASPLLDLAGLAAMNDFGEAERVALVEAYYRGGPPCSRYEFDRAVRLVKLMSGFWAAATALGARDPEPYRRLAAQFEAGLE